MITLATSNEKKATFLNTWASREEQDLHDFLKIQVASTDLFFLTEVTHTHPSRLRNDGAVTALTGLNDLEKPLHINSYGGIVEILDEYEVFYRPSTRDVFQCLDSGNRFVDVGFGSLMAIKKDMDVRAVGSNIICKGLKSKDDNKSISERVFQWVVYEVSGTRYLVAHLHGVWIRGLTKEDHPARDQQSKEVLSLIRSIVRKHNVTKVVFGGDLNLAPDTKALAILLSGAEPWSLKQNLIEKFGITGTRTPLYRKHGVLSESQFADYVLTSTNVDVGEFQVWNGVPVSDHAPLIVRFS